MERPILFNTAMVRAILDGRKTQTRRVVKHELIIHQAEFECGNKPNYTVSEPSLQYWVDNSCPYGQVGDLLWIRETFGAKIRNVGGTPHESFAYKADNPDEIAYSDCNGEAYPVKWKPSIHMPRAACRLILEITNIRVERLKDITESDSMAEGVESLDSERDVHDFSICPRCGGTRLHGALGHNMGYMEVDCHDCDTYKKRFEHLWESINGTDSWDIDPWVWVLEFRVVKGGAV